ncbi:Membrane protein of ER body 1 [Linum perenne]
MAAAVAEQHHQWRMEEGEGEEEEPLKGRQQQKNPTTYAQVAAMEPPSSNGNGSHEPSTIEKPPQPIIEEADEKPVEASDTFHSNGSSDAGTNGGYTVTTTTVILPTEVEGKNKEEVLTVASSSSTVSIREVKQVEEVVLESVYQKPATQEFFCPNCQSCIQKVILRDREAELNAAKPAAPSRPQKRFRCADCFAFLIPVGNWIFGRGQDDADYENLTDQASKVPSTGAVPGQGKPPSAVPSPALPVHGKAPLSGSTSEPKPGSSELAGDESNGDVSVTSRDPSVTGKSPHQPGNDSDKIEVVIRKGEEDSVDVTKHKHKVSIGILGVLITKLPGMRAKQLGELNQGLLDVIEDDEQTAGTQLPVSSPTTSFYPREAPVPVPGTSGVNIGTSQQPTIRPPRAAREWDILKSIVYGGLAELITSLSIVTSAASADTETPKILAIGVANLIGGIFILTTNIWDLRCEQPRKLINSIEAHDDQAGAEVDRYCDNLGKRTNFKRHTFFAVLSFLVFGLIPPVVYGFSFKETDDRDYKIAASAAVSLVCVFLLAIGKAHVQKPPRTYLKSVAFYVTAGVMASGVSFLAGELFKKVMDDLGTFAPPVGEAPPAANWVTY